MATATLSRATIRAAATATVSTRKPYQKRTKVDSITGLNSFGGLKAPNKVVSYAPVSTQQSFTKIVNSYTYPSRSKGKRRGNGLLTATCSAIDEIFKIAAIIPGLVLVGVAVGFVLLRFEAFVEESE